MSRGRRTVGICAEPGCPEDGIEGGRCPQHRRLVVGTGARGSTYKGRKIRERVLEKAEDAGGVPRCFYCGAEADIADHYVPVSEGGADTEENQVAACRPCNSRKGKQMPSVFMKSSWLARRCEEVATERRASP